MTGLLETEFRHDLGDFSLDVSFTLNKEIGVLFGPSGAGKSMTLRILSGLVNPDYGSIALNNRQLLNTREHISVKTADRDIGVVFQDLSLFPHLTVMDNVRYGLEKRYIDRAGYWIEKMHLSGLEDRFPSQLSGGQRQRTALARSLAPQPKLLLLDEPFSALDTPLKRNLRRELKLLHRETGIPMLYVTHYMEDVSALGNTVFFMKEGKITATADVDDMWSGENAGGSWHSIGWGTIVEGQIIADNNKTCLAWDGGRLVLGGSTERQGRGVVFVPPNRIKLLYEDIPVDKELRHNIFEGTIIEILRLGHFVSMYIEAAGLHWHLEFPPESYRSIRLREGEDVRLSIRPGDISVIER